MRYRAEVNNSYGPALKEQSRQGRQLFNRSGALLIRREIAALSKHSETPSSLFGLAKRNLSLREFVLVAGTSVGFGRRQSLRMIKARWVP